MPRNTFLLVDAGISLVLGVLLLIFPADLVKSLGMPTTDQAFYRAVLGAILVGIGISLLIEFAGRWERATGLGLAGAAAINSCAALALAALLAYANLGIPGRGRVLLWVLAVLLLAISAAELHRIKRAARE
jgi:hypothetical protein